MNDLNAKITEIKLEEIRVYLSKTFPKCPEETRQSALNFVVENFHSRHLEAIREANK